MAIISSLTKEQEAKMTEYQDTWIKIGLATGPCDVNEATKAAKLAYKIGGLPEPKHFLCFRSPIEAAKAALVLTKNPKLLKKKVLTSEEVKELFPTVENLSLSSVNSHQIYGFHEAGWLSFYSYMKNVVGVTGCEAIEGLEQLAKVCGWWAPYSEVAIFQDRPEELHMDSENRLHNSTGAAVKYSDGFGVWAIHGVRVKKEYIETPESITTSLIDAEQNAEVRRVMLDIFGTERYIQQSNCVLIQEDSFGKLWKKDLPDDEPIMMVEVINKTPEPMPTWNKQSGMKKEEYLKELDSWKKEMYKHYFLRVHPQLFPMNPDMTYREVSQQLTAHNAVASTFGLLGKEYNPDFES